MDRKQYLREYYKRNRDKMREQGRAHYQANKEAYKERARTWEEENSTRATELKNEWRRSDKGILQSRNWTELNRDKHNDINRRSKQKHIGRVRAEVRTRQANKLKATPAWASREAIRAIYEAAERINQATGTEHNVDHSIALYATDAQNNHIACGLHCEANLAILTETDNLSKGTKLIEDLDTWLATHSVTEKISTKNIQTPSGFLPNTDGNISRPVQTLS